MRMFVKAEVFETITTDEEVARLRDTVGQQIKKIMESGKLELGWVAVDARSPMFIFNVDSAAEVLELLGGAFVDHFKIETHPIISLEELAKFFAEHPPGR